MELGATFHACDLQIHSPRDENWNGACPTTHDERQAFAREFVQACFAKALDAVAITDHHDIAFYPYILEAAQTEAHPSVAGKRLVIFPGLELTLAVPCQALLLFDPDTPFERLQRAVIALGINAAPAADAKTAPTTRLVFNDLNTVQDTLDNQVGLKGHYILLPNVNAGGGDTILRTGFADKYRTMRCVGGYVDGTLAGHARRNIIDGNDPQWGSRAIGVIQTSDARSRDFARLAENRTWIKWSTPTAEAIRQACLARASRLRHTAPDLPTSYVAKITVSNSKYFGPLTISFNPQVNAIIGGRGSGKSTILEYLRWALCDQPYVHSEDEEGELPDYEKRRRSLVATTLKATEGNVAVEFVKNNVRHTVRREGTTGRVWLKVGDQVEQETSEEVIQSFANIQGYSQKQLSHVSVRNEELLRLLRNPIANELATTETHRKDTAGTLRQAFGSEESRRALDLQLQAVELDLNSKREQTEKVKEGITDLPQDQQQAIDDHPAFVAGDTALAAYRSALASAVGHLTTARSAVLGIKVADTKGTNPENTLQQLKDDLESLLKALVGKINDAIHDAEQFEPKHKESFGAVATAYTAHDVIYQAASSGNVTIQSKVTALKALNSEIQRLNDQCDEIRERLAQLGNTAQALADARAGWTGHINREYELLAEQATRLNAESGGELRIVIRKGGETEHLREAVTNAIKGAGITTPEKFQTLIDSVNGAADPLQRWITIAEEFVQIARVGQQLASGASLPMTPALSSVGFTVNEVRRMAAKVSPQAAFELTLLAPQSLPVFEYRRTSGDYIPFAQASPGQQANALLSLLLNQSAGPLVIDQPEDDLDNSTVARIAERLWAAKEKRQLIFSTHNPNLVVIGDAELILHCDYRQDQQATGICLAHAGGLDERELCAVVADVMEGGENAFRLRMDRYGF